MKLTAKQIGIIRSFYKQRCCASCGWMKANVSWWCMNEKARATRGTSIPGVHNCPYWKLDREYMIKQLKQLKQ